MNFLSNVVGYSGKLFFATIMFFAMIISTVVSLPFIGAGMIKDAINAHHHHQAEESNLIDEYSEYWYMTTGSGRGTDGMSVPLLSLQGLSRLCPGGCLRFALNEVVLPRDYPYLFRWPHFQSYSCPCFLPVWLPLCRPCARRSSVTLSKRDWWGRLSNSFSILPMIR